MPRYFIHVANDRSWTDHEGLDLEDSEAAWAEAVTCAGEMLRDMSGAFSGREWRMKVADTTGETVLTLRFSGERGRAVL